MKPQHLLSAATIAVGFTLGATGVQAANTISNVVFIVDESGSMSGEHAFLQNVITDLDTALGAAGVTSRSYGVIGFGNSSIAPRVVGAMADASTTKTNLGNLVINGGTEDGYAGINYALNKLNYTPGAAINYVLVTDEDRDNWDHSLSYTSILNDLTKSKILLNAVVNASFTSDAGSALGIDSGGDAYIADGSGGFTTSTNGSATSGYGTTINDYINLAIATGGAAWDLNKLRAGGNLATSFTNAFIDIKVQEITSQPPSPGGQVPLPATLPMLAGGVGAIGLLRRRRKAKKA